MKFKAYIDVMPLKEILDPQGKAVKLGLSNLGITGMEDVKIGKRIEIELSAPNKDEADEKVQSACKQLLTNLITEDYQYTIEELQEA